MPPMACGKPKSIISQSKPLCETNICMWLKKDMPGHVDVEVLLIWWVNIWMFHTQQVHIRVDSSCNMSCTVTYIHNIENILSARGATSRASNLQDTRMTPIEMQSGRASYWPVMQAPLCTASEIEGFSYLMATLISDGENGKPMRHLMFLFQEATTACDEWRTMQCNWGITSTLHREY